MDKIAVSVTLIDVYIALLIYVAMAQRCVGSNSIYNRHTLSSIVVVVVVIVVYICYLYSDEMVRLACHGHAPWKSPPSFLPSISSLPAFRGN